MHEQVDQMVGFDSVVTSFEELEALYRPPSQMVLDKETTVIDDGIRSFIAASTLVLVGTANAQGRQDVSPRGGPAGFVKVLDEQRLVIPDLNGNNRLDTIRNIVEQPRIGLLFVVAGLGETVRINGRACITTDDAVLELFTDELRRPTTAIGVEVEQGFLHCAKAFRRGGIWKPDRWLQPEGRPSPGEILVANSGLTGQISATDVETRLEESYRVDLAADLPEPETS